MRIMRRFKAVKSSPMTYSLLSVSDYEQVLDVNKKS
jgi:hypothetical protein